MLNKCCAELPVICMFALNKCCAELLVIYICILVAVAIIVGVNAPMSPAKDLLNLHLICYKFTIASE
jgi:hypothetical protein